MTTHSLIVLALLTLAATATTLFAQSTQPTPASPIAPNATPQKLPHAFSFTEGPACDSHGNVFFTDQPNDAIWKFNPDTRELSLFLKPAGRSNGLCFDAHDNLLACADEHNQLWSISPDKQITILLKDYQQKLLNGPNDLWLLPPQPGQHNQALYFTDPLYKRDYWTRDPARQQPGEYVYFLSADRKTLKPVITDLQRPNGIIGTPDGKTLYVSDIGSNQTFSYTLHPDGSLSDKKPFCPMGSDGMTIDSDGNLYLTNHGVTIFSPTGQKLAHIEIPDPWTANVCFAGKDRHTLIITASKSLYTLHMRTHGVNSQ